DKYLCDGVVVQERLDRAEAEDLVHDLLEHSLTLDTRDDDPFLIDELVEHFLDGRLDRLRVGQIESRVQVVDDPALEARANVALRVARRRGGLRERTLGGRLRGVLYSGCARLVGVFRVTGSCAFDEHMLISSDSSSPTFTHS